MRARVALLEGEKRGNEGALRDLARRCRMLEGVLRAERYVHYNYPSHRHVFSSFFVVSFYSSMASLFRRYVMTGAKLEFDPY
jgi:hypothetical protein